MAKNKNSKIAADVLNQTEQPVTEQAAEQVQEPESGSQAAEQPATLTFSLARITPNGVASYELPGLRGSIYVTKSMWAGEPPQALTIVATPFAQPKAGASKTSGDPEAAAKKAAVARERADKAQVRAAKALAAAQKPAERLAKLVPATPVAAEETEPAEQAPVTEETAEVGQ
jgi:hypothetical protein